MTKGTITTFYSFKGGVGRTFILANIATLLAKWGYRVLCVDWDIEAPGLDFYFKPFLRTDPGKGLVHIFGSPSGPDTKNWRDYVTPISIAGATRKLNAIFSGRSQNDYVAMAQSLDWKTLYAKSGVGSLIDSMCSQWKDQYDIILVDSRTGITDVGGICTAQIPDILCIVVASNSQSIEGALDIARRAQAARSSLPQDRAGLPVVPIPSRFDVREEYETAKHWLGRIAQELSPQYTNWLDERASVDRLIELTRVPYVGYWSYGERLPAIEERASDPESISYKFSTIAALLAHNLSETDKLAVSPDAYIQDALKIKRAKTQRDPRYSFDVYLSYTRDNERLAHRLNHALTELEVRVFFDAAKVSLGRDFRDLLAKGMADSKHYVMLYGQGPAIGQNFQQYELLYFNHIAQGDDGRRAIVVQTNRLPLNRPVMLVPGAEVRWTMLDGSTLEVDDIALEIITKLNINA